MYLSVMNQSAAFLFLHARGAFFQLLLIYTILSVVPTVPGVFLLVMPCRAGNMLSDAFAIFPAVDQKDWSRKML